MDALIGLLALLIVILLNVFFIVGIVYDHKHGNTGMLILNIFLPCVGILRGLFATVMWFCGDRDWRPAPGDHSQPWTGTHTPAYDRHHLRPFG